jgi:hypothetical protein
MLPGAEILLGAEISTFAIVLSHITRRMNSVCPQQFSAAIFRLNLGIRHNFHETQKSHVFVKYFEQMLIFYDFS